MVASTKRSRYHWRDATMLMLTFYHGLRASELCHLRRSQVDLKHGHIWVERLQGTL
jgi:integrase